MHIGLTICHPPGTTGQGTYHSSSTTRTSTKNVFLLTRFLNVSAKGENFSYVKCGLRSIRQGLHGMLPLRPPSHQPLMVLRTP